MKSLQITLSDYNRIKLGTQQVSVIWKSPIYLEVKPLTF